MLGQNVFKVMFIELSHNIIFDIGSHNIERKRSTTFSKRPFDVICILMNNLRNIFRMLNNIHRTSF